VGKGRIPLAAIAVFVVLATPSTAVAAVRFAAPGASGAEPCNPNPCSIQNAATGGAVANGDEVVVMPGDYPLASALIITRRIDLHGQAGQPRPRLIGSAGVLQSSIGSSGSTVHDLEMIGSGGQTVLNVFPDPIAAERLIVQATGANAACGSAADGAVIRDSVCWNSGSGQAVATNFGGGTTINVELRNVTAVAAGTSGSARRGISLTIGGGGKVVYDAVNVIASGASTDVFAGTDSTAGSSAIVKLDHSNYATQTENGTTGTTASVTDPGSGTNQIAPPRLAAPAGGDFHQLPGSPTIDAGVIGTLLGPVDLDGDARLTGAAPDIGADEFVPLAADTDPPETTITKKPRRTTLKRKAKFGFSSDEPGSTFECRLDKKGFSPCASPDVLTKLKRLKHSFQVRATDAVGNVDATPARFKWRVRKPG